MKKIYSIKTILCTRECLGYRCAGSCEPENISGKLFQPVVSLQLWDQPPAQNKNLTASRLLPGLSSHCPPAARFDDIIHDLISCRNTLPGDDAVSVRTKVGGPQVTATAPKTVWKCLWESSRPWDTLETLRSLKVAAITLPSECDALEYRCVFVWFIWSIAFRCCVTGVRHPGEQQNHPAKNVSDRHHWSHRLGSFHRL